MVGIIMKSKFVVSGAEAFGGYIEYIDREEAVNPYEYENYVDDYMANPEKTYGLFTVNQDALSNKEKESVKSIFSNAQDKGSLLWQTVISFDTNWLVKNGLYNYDQKEIDEEKLKEYTRTTMNLLSAKEGFTAFWTGAIHKNTEHIHIHIAMIETNTSHQIGVGRCRQNAKGEIYQRGKFEQRNMAAAKRKFASCVLHEQYENKKINEITRNYILSKEHNLLNSDIIKLRIQFVELAKLLPNDLRLLKYNNNAMKEYRDMIDKLSDNFIKEYYKKEWNELNQLLEVQQEKYAETFGGDSDFANNKRKDLYERLGNSILTEIRQYKKEKRNDSGNLKYETKTYHSSAINAIKQNMKKDIQSCKNQSAYDRLRQQEDYER